MILHMIFPLVETNHFGIFMACICWAVTEVTRFTFYTLKELNLFKVTNPFAELIGHMRYNSFIVLYPIGVSGELICCFKAWQTLSAKPVGQKEFTYSMPNALNIAFDWESCIFYGIPTIYILFFPQLYMHMWTQRRKHYDAFNKEKSKISLFVPEKYKLFQNIDGVKALVESNGKFASVAATESKLQHRKGEVWLVDFWATWCPPCQQPMEHNQQMMKRNAKKWGPDVRIICVSCDKDSNKLLSHVNAKKWTDIEHFV